MAEIALLVIDPRGDKHAELVEDSRPVRDLIPVLVRRLGMPAELGYQMIPAATGRALPVDFSPARSGVGAGSEVYLNPVRDDLFTSVLRQLYKEAKDHVRDRLWKLAREKLEEIMRVDPQYPDPAGIVHVVFNRTVEPRSPGAEPRGRSRGRPRRQQLDYGRDAAVSAAPGGSSGAASVLGVLVVLAGLGIAAYVWVPWDKVKQEFQKHQQQAQVNAPGKVNDPKPQLEEKDAYAIWLVGDGEEVICGRRSEIEKTPTGHLHGWGLDNVKTVGESGVSFKMARGPFPTAEEARKAYEAELIPGSTRDHNVANYTSAQFRFSTKKDQRHMIDNATRFLR
jgi:hypothetical protein